MILVMPCWAFCCQKPTSMLLMLCLLGEHMHCSIATNQQASSKSYCLTGQPYVIPCFSRHCRRKALPFIFFFPAVLTCSSVFLATYPQLSRLKCMKMKMKTWKWKSNLQLPCQLDNNTQCFMSLCAWELHLSLQSTQQLSWAFQMLAAHQETLHLHGQGLHTLQQLQLATRQDSWDLATKGRLHID